PAARASYRSSTGVTRKIATFIRAHFASPPDLRSAGQSRRGRSKSRSDDARNVRSFRRDFERRLSPVALARDSPSCHAESNPHAARAARRPPAAGHRQHPKRDEGHWTEQRTLDGRRTSDGTLDLDRQVVLDLGLWTLDLGQTGLGLRRVSEQLQTSNFELQTPDSLIASFQH